MGKRSCRYFLKAALSFQEIQELPVSNRSKEKEEVTQSIVVRIFTVR